MNASRVLVPLQRAWQQKAIRRSIQIAWVAIIAVCIALALFSNWDAIRSITWTPERLGLIGLAVAATLLRRLAGGLRWVWVVRWVGQNNAIGLRQHLKVYFVSNLATYIPGTYWFIAGRIVMNNEQGMNAFQTGVSTLLEHFLLILSGALLSIFGLDLVARALDVQVESFLWIVLVVVVGLAAIHPWSINQITKVMARVLRVEPIPLSLSYGTMLLYLSWSLGIWLLGSLSLLLLTKAFVPETGFDQLGMFSAIFATSWLIGFFTPFAPSGIGVREGILGVAFAALGIPLGITVLLAALSRLLIIFEDLSWGMVGMLL